MRLTNIKKSTDREKPVAWLLPDIEDDIGEGYGRLSQVEGIARALNANRVIVNSAVIDDYDDVKDFLRKSIKGKDDWPDFIISSGKGSSTASVLFKELLDDSVVTIHSGAKGYHADHSFDVLTIPESAATFRYGDNIVKTVGVPHRLSEKQLKKAGKADFPPIDDLPHPKIMLAVGDGKIDELGGEGKNWKDVVMKINDLVKESGGSLLITSSPRTREELMDTIKNIVDVPNYTYNFKDDNGAHSPYRRMVAKSDQILVTGDSLSMISEAVSTDKPTRIIEYSGKHAEAMNLEYQAMIKQGMVKVFEDDLEHFDAKRYNVNEAIAEKALDVQKQLQNRSR